MLRNLLLIAALTFAAAARAQEPPDWFALSFLDIREDAAEAAKQGKRLMIYFHQDGCPYCKRLVEVNFRDPKIVEAMRRDFVSIDINIFGSREVTWTDGRRMPEKALASLLRIQFTPTLVFFDERAEVAHRINGYLPPEPFLAALQAARGAGARQGVGASGVPVDLRRPEGSRPLAVMLVKPQCPACDEMRRHLAIESVRKQVERLELLALEQPAAILLQDGAATLSSSYVPALVFFDAGREVFRTEAYLRPFHLASAMEYVASGAYVREPSFQRFLHEKTARMKSRGERVDLWN